MTTEQHWGANSEDWFHLTLLDLTADLLPVVSNPHAEIDPPILDEKGKQIGGSRLKEIGKVPSLYNDKRKVSGIARWPLKQSSTYDVDAWSQEPDYGICLQARTIRAFDIDVPDTTEANKIRDEITSFLGKSLPLRFRKNSGKCLLAFRLKGEFAKRKMDVAGGIVEFLANGQQFIAYGTHPSGARYEWINESGDFPEITEQELEAVWNHLTALFSITKPTSEKNALRQHEAYIPTPDPLADYLTSHEAFLGEGNERQLFITCPFKDQHTGDSGETETVYFPKGTNGYPEGHFKCMHAHCQGKSDSAFALALGYHDSDFEVCDSSDDFDLPKEAEKEGDTFPNFTAAEYLQRPRPTWIIHKIVPHAEIAAIYGESGAGKTFLAVDMGLSIAQGIDWLGRKTKQGRVVYIVAEGAGGFRNRLEAYALDKDVDIASIPFHVIPAAPNFLDKPDCVKVARTVIRDIGKTEVIFVDTLSQVTIGGNENAAEDMSKAISNCKKIHEATGALVILIHHAGKDLERGLRGWSGLKGALDANIEVLKGDGELRTMRVEKLKDGRDGDAWSFRLKEIQLPVQDLDEEPESSPVVDFIGVSSNIKKRKLEKLRGEWRLLVRDAWERLRGNEEYVNEVQMIEKAMEIASAELPKKGRSLDNIRRAIYGMKKENIIDTDENLCVTIAYSYRKQ